MYPLKGILRIRAETDVSQEAAIANASLIIAAPALYAACKAIVENHADGPRKANEAIQAAQDAQQLCLSRLHGGQ